MKNRRPTAEAQYTKKRKRRLQWRRITVCLAAIVVFCTTYALILPAITMEKGCQLPEHTHSEDCFTQITEITDTVPVCTPDTLELHQHKESCYNDQRELTCGYADFVIHTHDASCYDEEGNLWCPLPQVKEHTHDSSCYLTPSPHVHDDSCYTQERGELLCGEHVHTDACWTEVIRLVCQTEETDLTAELQPEEGQELPEPHQHTDGCYETTLELTCGYQGDHQHTDDCYAWSKTMTCQQSTEAQPVLVCEKAEIIYHQHTAQCYDQYGKLICGKAQILKHQHTADCFEDVTVPVDTEVLTCTNQDEDHVHSALCYGTWELHCQLQEHTHNQECSPDLETPPEPEPDLEQEAPGATSEIPEEQSSSLESDSLLESTLEPEPEEPIIYFCGMEEHLHQEGCYDEDGTLTCTLPEHTHTEDCTTAQQEPIIYFCGMEEHLHQEGCFDEEGTLICLLLEHTHTETCTTAQQEPIIYFCGMEEHLHQEGCYDEEGTLICLLPEHTHTEDCTIEPEPVYHCGKEEHLHSEACYDQNGTLVCQLEEHQHTEECLVPPLTDEEIQANEEEFLKQVQELEALGALTEETTTLAQELLTALQEAFEKGEISQEVYEELTQRLEALLTSAYDGIAEACYGTNWIQLRDSGWFNQYGYASLSTMSLFQEDAAWYIDLQNDENAPPSAVQINEKGGQNSSDDVTVSKTIAGTDLENVFDITLTVQTPQKIDEVISEPDMAVVIVMDISNTMKDNFGGVTRYAAAMEAAEDFLDKFQDNNSLGISKVGYVAFNTDAHQIFGLQSCTNKTQANALKNTMRTSTGNIINANGYGESHNRFTNIEGGLKMAQDMLNGVSNKNKFIILLTDGFPTTYISSGYTGYDPYDSSGRFYDHVLGKPCLYGTSYSDEAAIRARNMAASIKNSGTTIFSIGVDVGGQTIQEYITSSEKPSAHSIVDRTSTTYEIGDATSTEAYKNWLRNSIGSGYYYDSTNTQGLKDAYNQIFEQIKTTIETAAKADWVTEDPIPVTTDHVELIGLYNKDMDLVNGSLKGTHEEGNENTAVVPEDGEADTITWDLKASGYTIATSETSTIYSYQLKYRVRLKNEENGFIENEIYNTNGTTTLTYRLVQTINGTTTISDQKKIEFPVPSVHGFLADLEFNKIAKTGDQEAPLSGAEFTLEHADQCSQCRGDGTQVELAPMTATSDENGTVRFENIPSGHTYTLTETIIPDGYSPDGSRYQVTVAYDTVTVTATDSAQKPVTWEGKIINNAYYELPDTGGVGTRWYIAAGLALILISTVLLYYNRHRRRGEPSSF